ncbi:MAG: glutathione S-transferase family protein [Candidatus Lambdaproteobacteria bacterium]|nr:glutathione S-transferase family protein [Candidatus Lambdaproteobacteria bacterium]
MKLYMHPVSMTSRTVRLFIAEENIPMDEQVIDLFTGEHHREPYISINPNRQVPVLDDGDFRLTESSTILKYLAEKTGSRAYPKDLKKRAKVNEMMDWFNTQFYRDWGYGMIYPQIFPHHKRPSDEIQSGTIAWGKERAEGWLQILNDFWIGPKNAYLCGSEITIADYFGIGLLTLGEVVHCDFAQFPNVARWVGNMKKLRTWPKVNEVFYGLVENVKSQPFVHL